MGGPPEKLRLNTGIQDPLLIGGASLWMYNHWHTVDNFFQYRTALSPQEPDTFTNNGALYRTFVVSKIADRAFQFDLEFDVSALTCSAGSPTYIRWADYLGYTCIDHIEVRHANNIIQKMTGDDLFLYNVKEMDIEERDAENVCVAGRLTQAQRNLLAQGTQHIIVRLPIFCGWNNEPGKGLNLFQLALEPRVIVCFKPLNAWIQTDANPSSANPTATISNLILAMETVHVEPHERDALTDMVRSKHGIVYKFDDISRQDWNVTTTSLTTSQIIPLDPHRGATKVMNIMCRISTDINGSTLINQPYENLQYIPSFSIQSVGQDLITPQKWNMQVRFKDFKRYYPAPAGTQVLFHSFARRPCNHNDATGSLNFANINKPQLVIYWTSTYQSPSSNYTITTTCEEHGFVQHSNGELISVITNN